VALSALLTLPLSDRLADPASKSQGSQGNPVNQVNCVIDPYKGREIFDGTLTAAALQTFWIGGFRDGAHPQRWSLNAEPVRTGVTADKQGVQVVRMNQMGVLSFKTTGDSGGTLGHFPPGLDPKSSMDAVADWTASLAVYAGISPSDITIGGGGTKSGVAIHLSRDGQRKARRKLALPMGRSDRLRLSQAAALLNAYSAGTPLPEVPEAYSVQYADMERTLEEVTAELAEAQALRDAGVIGRVDHYLRFHPGLTRDEAIEQMTRNALEDATIAASTPGDGGGRNGPRFLIGDKTTAQDIVMAVEAGDLSESAARALLVTMVGVADDEATRLLAGPNKPQGAPDV